MTDYFTQKDPEAKKIRLPELRPTPRDDLLIYCGILGIVLIGLGNWLVALNSVTMGLYVAVISSLGLKAAIVAMVDSSKTIDKAVLGVVTRFYDGQITNNTPHKQKTGAFLRSKSNTSNHKYRH